VFWMSHDPISIFTYAPIYYSCNICACCSH
jgi:hypothetical protein